MFYKIFNVWFPKHNIQENMSLRKKKRTTSPKYLPNKNDVKETKNKDNKQFWNGTHQSQLKTHSDNNHYFVFSSAWSKDRSVREEPSGKAKKWEAGKPEQDLEPGLTLPLTCVQGLTYKDNQLIVGSSWLWEIRPLGWNSKVDTLHLLFQTQHTAPCPSL